MLNQLKLPAPQDIPPTPQEFLKTLTGPTAIFLQGQNKGRTRVLVTLTHGHEPSGLEALHRWLREGRRPLVNILVILGGVEAAQINPPFFYRHAPDKRDLNRCFSPPYHDSQGKLAQEILQSIQKHRPEAIVDMHNTSAPTPPFVVACGENIERQMLAGIFVKTLIISGLRIGALMEQDLGCPIITLEVGCNTTPESLVMATHSLEQYFLRENLFEIPRELSIFRNPLRLELNPGSRIDFSDSPLENQDVTIRSDIDSLNFLSIGHENILGWASAPEHLHVRTREQMQPLNDYFFIQQGKLYPKFPMTIFMATMRADLAASDCIFYFVKE